VIDCLEEEKIEQYVLEEANYFNHEKLSHRSPVSILISTYINYDIYQAGRKTGTTVLDCTKISLRL
jgi:hypothetical protein